MGAKLSFSTLHISLNSNLPRASATFHLHQSSFFFSSSRKPDLYQNPTSKHTEMQSLKSQVVRCESLKVPGDAGSDPTLNCRNPLEDFGLSEISNIGCRVERIRPLVNLDQNKPNSRRASSPPKKISSLKAVLAATGLQNTMADDGKENVSPQANKHKRLLPHKGSKESHVNFKCLKKMEDVAQSAANIKGMNSIRGYNEGYPPLSFRRVNSVNSGDFASQAINMQDDQKQCFSNLSKAAEFSAIANSLQVPAIFDTNQRNNGLLEKESILPLLESSSFAKNLVGIESDRHANSSEETSFWKSGLDKIHKLYDTHLEDLKEDKEGHSTEDHDICVSSTDCSASYGCTRQETPIIGADLTLGLSTDMEEALEGVCSKVPAVTGKGLLNEDTVPNGEPNLTSSLRDVEIDTGEGENAILKESQEDQNFTLSYVSEQNVASRHSDKHEMLKHRSLSHSQLESEVSLCSFAPNSMDSNRNHKNHTVNQVYTRKQCMPISDLPMPTRGTLLLPRGQKRLGRYSTQLKRLKQEAIKPKRDGGKKEQSSKFSRSSAPSGLLAELNPGIINRVRNSKQVHAIIEAVVGSDALLAYQESRNECPQDSTTKSDVNALANAFDSGDTETLDTSDAFENGIDNVICMPVSEAQGNTASGSSAWDKSDMLHNADISDEHFHGMAATRDSAHPLVCSRSWDGKQPAGEECKQGEELTCNCQFCCPNEYSALDMGLAASLSTKAAVVASQWLDINCQDLKGRLAALKRSRKRVRAVIKERFRFPVNQTLSASSEGEAYRNLERDHMEKWRTLFVHMDNCLSSEASQLESKLQRMKDLLTHCHQGLEGFQKITSDALQQPNVMEGNFRPGTTSEQIIEKRFAVEAAAASLYSTANFVSVTEHMPSL